MFGDFAINGEDVFEEVKRVLARRSTPAEPVAHMGTLLGTESSSPGPVPPSIEECGSHQAAALDPPRTQDESTDSAVTAPTDYVTGDADHRIALTV